jgi:hypothetical protein
MLAVQGSGFWVWEAAFKWGRLQDMLSGFKYAKQAKTPPADGLLGTIPQSTSPANFPNGRNEDFEQKHAKSAKGERPTGWPTVDSP